MRIECVRTSLPALRAHTTSMLSITESRSIDASVCSFDSLWRTEVLSISAFIRLTDDATGVYGRSGGISALVGGVSSLAASAAGTAVAGAVLALRSLSGTSALVGSFGDWLAFSTGTPSLGGSVGELSTLGASSAVPRFFTRSVSVRTGRILGAGRWLMRARSRSRSAACWPASARLMALTQRARSAGDSARSL